MTAPDAGEVDLDWRISCAIQITRWWLHSAEPADDFRDWLDEAGAGDEQYMRYAMRAFEQTSHLNALELEERLAMLVRWRDRRHDIKDEFPF